MKRAILLPAVIFILLGGACATPATVEPLAPATPTPSPTYAPALPAPTSLAPPAPALPEVPDLLGKKLAVAKANLEGEGFDVRVVRKVTSAHPAGQVYAERPAPGTEVDEGSTITLIVAKAPPPPSPSPSPTKTTSSSSSNCDPNYSGACLDPNASDYDCAGGSGNGPLYVSGTVTVVGDDHYGLDADGDGLGCE
jgi:hypothetical protein